MEAIGVFFAALFCAGCALSARRNMLRVDAIRIEISGHLDSAVSAAMHRYVTAQQMTAIADAIAPRALPYRTADSGGDTTWQRELAGAARETEHWRAIATRYEHALHAIATMQGKVIIAPEIAREALDTIKKGQG